MPFAFDDAHAPLYSVGQVAGMLGLQPAFVRRLDSEQVVQPARSEGGQRRYSQNEVHQVQRVADLAEQGHTLLGIRRLLELEQQVAELRAELERVRRTAGPAADRNPGGRA